MALIAPIPIGAWPARLRISRATPATANGTTKARVYQTIGCRHAVIRWTELSERALTTCHDNRRECRSDNASSPKTRDTDRRSVRVQLTAYAMTT